MERTATPPQPWPPSSLLAHLSADARDGLLTLGTARRYRVRQVLMREGERTTHAILLRAGFVKVTAVADGGRNALIAVRMAGDLIGELGAIDGAPRAATVVASAGVCGNDISRGELLSFLREHPDASFAVTGMVGARLRQANKRRLDVMGFAVRARIARVLIELGERFGHDTARAQGFELPITQQDLAEFAGTTQVSVQRALRALRAEGLLTTGYGRIAVKRVEALRDEGHVQNSPIASSDLFFQPAAT